MPVNLRAVPRERSVPSEQRSLAALPPWSPSRRHRPRSPATAQTTEARVDLSVFAGTVSPGSADGNGAAARFNGPAGAAVDAAGNLYISDTGNGTIRKITPAGVVTTLAGSPGLWGSTDDTGSAARFSTPLHLAVDSSGTVFVADAANGALRKITAGGVVTTFDLSAARPAINGLGGVAVTPDGQTVYFTDRGNNVVRRIVAGGAVTVFAGDPLHAGSAEGTSTAARFYEPTGLARDAAGNLYVADSRNHTIRKITSGGVVTTLAGTAGVLGSADGVGPAAQFYLPRAVAVDRDGNVYVADAGNHTVRKIAASGAAVTTVAGTAEVAGSATGTGAAARFDLPAALAALGDGTLYVTDSRNNVVRKITPAGVVTTFAGVAPASTNGTGAVARFRQPQALDCDGAGNLYVADAADSVVRRITPAGAVSILAGTAGLTGTADGTGAAARFNQPEGILAATDGTVYVADTLNHTIRKITTAGIVTTLAGTAGEQGDADGSGAAARFRHPQGLAFDNEGNLVVADTFNNMIRRITPAGVVTTVAGTSAAYSVGARDGTGPSVQFEHPSAVAVNAAGEIFVADSSNAAIRKVDNAGTVSTAYGVKGSFGTSDGNATGVRFRRPLALAFDAAGNLLVADPDAATVRLIAPDGTSFTVAGLGDTPGALDGAGPVARLRGPRGVAVAPNGAVYIADTGNNVIRRGVVEWGTPPTFTQQPTKLRNVTPYTYTVQATSTGGVLHYRWQFQPKWGWWTDCASDSRFSGSDTDTLVIPGMTPALTDTKIRCLIDNGYSTVVASDAANLWMAGDTSVRITGDSADIELVVTVSTLAGAPRTQDQWGSSWGIVDGGGTAAKFSGPRGVVIAADGTAYVADAFGGTIRQVLPDGTVTTLAGKAGTASGEGWGNVDGTGDIARFAGPQALAFAPDGALIVADTDNGTVRRVTRAGEVTTLTDNAGQPHRFNRPQGVVVDRLGTIYVADTDDLTVRKIAPDGSLSLLAGRSLVSGAQDGPGASATFGSPTALALDPAGVLFVVDRGNHTIRRIAADGTVSTFVGLAGRSGGDDGQGAAARFNQPTGIAFDSRGVLYVADAGNHVVRMITADGSVRTIAGRKPAGQDRGWGYSDGAGASARFWNPWALACDNHGNLIVADAGNSQIRSVATRVPFSGETLTFGVNTQGNPGGFQWQAQEPGASTWTNITTGGPYTVSGGGDSGRLAVVVDASFDRYHFRCHVSRAYDHTEIDGRSAVIAVGIAPTITTQPVAVSATAGQRAGFTVAATGTPALFAYRWQRRAGGAGDWADLAESAVFRGTRTATLSLPSVGGAMNGDQFRCVVDNYVATAATSAPATLTVSGEAYVDFASWRAGNSVTGDANTVQAGSGVTNLARYAFGLAPSGVVVNPVSITATTGTGTRYLQVGFKRKTAASDIHYVIQASADLVNWTTLKTIEPGSPIGVLEQDNVAIGSVPRRFLRVKVEPKP
ncbi:MAG: SMP-30/gluconolactonase/LRE family protein [Opitutaceae bacterium]|nr:SMP-30/gluconolactonase/LRE family protein [Opitutaceae bacterium]